MISFEVYKRTLKPGHVMFSHRDLCMRNGEYACGNKIMRSVV